MTDAPLTAAECDRFEAEMWAAERMRPGALPLSEADADALDEARGRLGAERLLKAIDELDQPTKRETMNKHVLAAAALTLYVAAIVTANVVTDHLGLVWVWPGLVTTAGTYAAGFALLARDFVQEAGGVRLVLAGIATGALLSYWLSSPQLALASGVAFGLAELADLAVYTPLRRRGFVRAALASNVVGAIVDTFIFLKLAGFPLIPEIVAGQLVGKILWATIIPLAVIALGRLAFQRRAVTA